MPENNETSPCVSDLFPFAEWAATNYIRLHGVWVHRYKSQMDKENWIETKNLYKLYKICCSNKLDYNPIIQ